MSNETQARPTWSRRHPSWHGKPCEFDVTLPTTPVQDLAVRWGGYQYLAGGDPPNVHTSLPYGLLIFAVSGDGRFACEGGHWPVRPGTILWASPGLSCRVELAPGSPGLEHYALLLFGKKTTARFERSFTSEAGAAQLIDPDSIAHLFEAIIDEGCAQSEHVDRNCIDLVKVLLRRLEDHMIREGRLAGSNARETYYRARRYIQMNYASCSELKEIASAIGISTPYLCRLFERYDILSPFGYLTQLKLIKGQRLLETSDLPAREIGEAVGYSDPALFSRKFKHAYGRSPAKYRKHYRETTQDLG